MFCILIVDSSHLRCLVQEARHTLKYPKAPFLVLPGMQSITQRSSSASINFTTCFQMQKIQSKALIQKGEFESIPAPCAHFNIKVSDCFKLYVTVDHPRHLPRCPNTNTTTRGYVISHFVVENI